MGNMMYALKKWKSFTERHRAHFGDMKTLRASAVA